MITYYPKPSFFGRYHPSTCLTTHSLLQLTITRPLFTTNVNVVTVFATNVEQSRHQLSSLDFVEDVYVPSMFSIQLIVTNEHLFIMIR